MSKPETTPKRNQVGLRLGEMLPGSTDNGEPGVPVTGKPETTEEGRPYVHESYLDELWNAYPTAWTLIQWQDAEIARLRDTLHEIRRDIEESADDVVWMRGGIETVCDRITAVLGDGHEQQL